MNRPTQTGIEHLRPMIVAEADARRGRAAENLVVQQWGQLGTGSPRGATQQQQSLYDRARATLVATAQGYFSDAVDRTVKISARRSDEGTIWSKDDVGEQVERSPTLSNLPLRPRVGGLVGTIRGRGSSPRSSCRRTD